MPEPGVSNTAGTKKKGRGQTPAISNTHMLRSRSIIIPPASAPFTPQYACEMNPSIGSPFKRGTSWKRPPPSPRRPLSTLLEAPYHLLSRRRTSTVAGRITHRGYTARRPGHAGAGAFLSGPPARGGGCGIPIPIPIPIPLPHPFHLLRYERSEARSFHAHYSLSTG